MKKHDNLSTVLVLLIFASSLISANSIAGAGDFTPFDRNDEINDGTWYNCVGECVKHARDNGDVELDFDVCSTSEPEAFKKAHAKCRELYSGIYHFGGKDADAKCTRVLPRVSCTQ